MHVVKLGDTHAKVLISDSSWAIVTSFNWLSFKGSRKLEFRDERYHLPREGGVSAALSLLHALDRPLRGGRSFDSCGDEERARVAIFFKIGETTGGRDKREARDVGTACHDGTQRDNQPPVAVVDEPVRSVLHTPL